MENKINVGDLVVSLSGRDRGSVYLVIQADEKFAVIVNGKTRKVNKPKRKKLKHLWIRPYVVEFIQNCLQEKKLLMDSDVRKALAVFEKADQKEEG